MTDEAWEKFKRRGEAIEKYNREHLRRLTLAEALLDLERVFALMPHFDVTPTQKPLPISLARLMDRARG